MPEQLCARPPKAHALGDMHDCQRAPHEVPERTLMSQAATRGSSAALLSALQFPTYFRIRDVMRITGLSRPTLYRRIAANRFPSPVHLGGRACGWHSGELEIWIKDPDGYFAAAAATSDKA